MKLGITGGIASGKSTVADLLQDKGVKVVDADKIAHQLMEPKTVVWEKIVDYFGSEILLSDNKIDRKKLGEIVFNDKTAKQRLEQITHPVVRQKLNKEMDEILTTDDLAAAEVALLIEADMIDLFDRIWVVYVDKEVQIKRLINRNGYNRATAENRVESQLSLKKKTSYADRIINNNGSQEQLEKKVEVAWQEINYKLKK